MWFKRLKILCNVVKKEELLHRLLRHSSVTQANHLHRTFSMHVNSVLEARTTHVIHKRACQTSSAKSSRISGEHILTSTRPQIDLKEETYVEFLFPSLDHYSSRVAMTDGITGRSLTHKELKEQVIRCASALKRLGYNRNDNIAIISPNNIEYVIMVIAAAACGVVFTTMNPLSPPLELARQFDLAGSTVYVTTPELLGNVQEAIGVSPRIQNAMKDIIVFGEGTNCRPFSSLLDDDGSLFPWNQDISPRDDTLQLLFSSGTTGLPKAVELTYFGLLSNASCFEPAFQESLVERGSSTSFGLLPFYHLYGQLVLIPLFLKLGIHVIILPRFEPESFTKNLIKYKVDFVTLVPPLALFLAKTPLLDGVDLSFVNSMICGAAPLKEDITEQVLSRFKNAHLSQGYGMTECGVPLLDSKPCRSGTCGRLVANARAKIVDAQTGNTLGPNQSGEIYLHTPFNMKGYRKNPQATKDVLVGDGWARTGDIGMYDSDGYLSVTDRLKEIILYKGHSVAPAELEAVLTSHPLVLDAAVIGVPDTDAGEVPKAFVVKGPESPLCEEDIHNHVKNYVSPWQYLRGGVEFVKEIPKTSSGKILRRLLSKT